MRHRHDLAEANIRPHKGNRSNPDYDYELFRKENPRARGREEKSTDLSRQHSEMQAVFFTKFYKAMDAPFEVPAVCIAREVPMGCRKESCHLRKCLIMLSIISSRKALPFSHQQPGEYKCLKREFLPSASSNLEGRSVHTSRWILHPASFWGKDPQARGRTQSKMQKCRYVQWCPYSLAKTYPALLWQATEFTNSDDPKLRAPQARRCRGGHALRTRRLDHPVRICGW